MAESAVLATLFAAPTLSLVALHVAELVSMPWYALGTVKKFGRCFPEVTVAVKYV